MYVIDVPDHLWFWSYRFGDDTKIGGSFMVMAIAGAAVLTQIQGIVSDQTGSIMAAYAVPAVAFAVIAYYGFFIARKQELTTE